MSKFVLTAQLQLQAPRNTNQVLNQMRQQLAGLTVPVNVKGAAQAQKQIQNVAKQTQKAASAAEAMGRSFGIATKRFAAFTVASRAVSLLTNSLATAIQEAVDFQREMIKISQVSGKTMAELKGLQQTITNLASSLGTSSTDLLKVTRVLAQAGVQARDLEVALAALAKTTLAATFDNIENTAEGAVAILRQFGEGVGALERQLGAINAVAGQFAVESGDLIGAVRRFGGVFKAAGGSLEELLAIFTSVRATTRESAESISTGLRTIFTRIQRPRTIAYLEQLGIKLTDAEGKFVGPMEAARKLSEALSGLADGDLRFIKIAEELGGFRQIGKVIPLLQQFETAQLAYNAAREGGNSLEKDAATAQQALSVQITKVREEFQGLVRSLTDSSSFQLFVRTSLELASALIKVGEALTPLIPLMAAFGSISLIKGMGGFLAGAGAGLRGKNQGGRIHGFARGGLVPGTGNRDTVPAMLSPGEFVIRQSSVQKMGAASLEGMNNNKYAFGGRVGILSLQGDGGLGPTRKLGDVTRKEVELVLSKSNQIGDKTTTGNYSSNPDDTGSVFKTATTKAEGVVYNQSDPRIARLSAKIIDKHLGGKSKKRTMAYGFPLNALASTKNPPPLADKASEVISGSLIKGVDGIASTVGKVFKNKITAKPAKQETLDAVGIKDIGGKLYEAAMTLYGAGGNKSKSGDDFDYGGGIGEKLANQLGSGTKKGRILKRLESIPTDAKRILYEGKSGLMSAIDKKAVNMVAGLVSDDPMWQQMKKSIRTINPKRSAQAKARKAAGGGIGGTDNVPALLTPGEFVVNRGAAQSIGYGNLNRMNRSGATRFAKGGTVGVQKFAEGGGVLGGGLGGSFTALAIALPAFNAAIDKFGDKSLEASDGMARFTIGTEQFLKAATQIVVGFMIFKAVGPGLRNLGQSLDNWSKGKGKKETDTTAVKGGERILAHEMAADLMQMQATKEAGVGGATAGEISQATFSVGSAVINVQSIQEAAGANVREFDSLEGQGIVPHGPAGGSAADAKVALDQRRAMMAERDQLKAGPDGNVVRGARDRAQNLESTQHGLRTQKGMAEGRLQKAREQARRGDPKAAGKIAAEESRLGELNDKIKENNAEVQAAKAAYESINAEVATNKDRIRELDAQIDLSTTSIRESGEARKRERDAVKASEAERKAAAKKARADAKKNVGYIEKQFRAMSIQAKKAGLRVKKFGQDSKKYVSVRLRAASIQMKRFGLRLKSLDRVKKVSNYLRGMGINAKRLGLRLKPVARQFSFITKPAKMAGQAIKSLGQRIRSLGKSAGGAMKRGVGAVGRGMSKAAGVGAAVGMAVNTIAAIGSAVTSALSQFAAREKDQAIKSENVSGASSAAGRQSTMDSIGEVFTLGGYIEAAKMAFSSDEDNFVSRRAERKQFAEAETATSTTLSANQRAVEDITKEGGDRFRRGDGSLDMRAAGDFLGTNVQKARSEIGDVKDPVQRAKLEAQLDAQNRASITTLAAKADTEEEAINMARKLAGHNNLLREKYIALARSTIALTIAQKELTKANFDSLKITSAFSGAKTAVDGFIAGLTTGSSELGGFIGQLETAQKTIGVDATDAINQMEESLLASADAAGAGPGLKSALSGQAGVARAANQFQQNIGGKISEGDFSKGDPEKAKQKIMTKLMEAIPDDTSNEAKAQMRKVITARVGAIEDVGQFDISELLANISGDASKLGKGFLEAAKLQDGHNNQMTKLYQQREQLEFAAAQALNKAINTQLEAAKIFEDFGGKALTTEQKTDARVAQFNNVGKMAGVNLSGGGAGDIRRAGEQLNDIVTNQNRNFQTDVMTRGGGAGGAAGLFAGAQGVQDDRREEATRANESLIQFTKQRITLLKEELSIVQKKNAAEKSSLDKLLAGDIEGFISGQAAAGAGAALRTGDAGLAGLFGSSALGAGFKGLKGQGLSDTEMQRAAGLSLGSVGINDTRSAQLLAGSTTEEEAIKAEGRELSGVMGDLAQQQAQFAEAKIEINEAVINAANLTFNRELKEISDRNQGLARGGMVYASRGMFVSRGTDTVPAMLTPGEFVVNRSAVQRGNNIQILRAMNGRGDAGAPGAAMSGGGVVRYYQNGDLVSDGGAGALSSVIPNLQAVFSDFAATVDKLVQTKFHVSLDPTNVNVNFNGASFLETMKEDIKKELLDEVGEQIKKSKPNTSGDLKTGTTVLGN